MKRSARYRGDLLVFDPIHFLEEAVDDFLASGSEPTKIASAVIKVATGVELLLKDKLEKICPALILDKIDVQALQVAKVFKLVKQLKNPSLLDAVELKTANFRTLLTRASYFIELSNAEQHLKQLHDIRNSLVHHQGEVDLLKTNLLLVKYIFPFIQNLGQTDNRFQWNLTASVWARIKKIEKASTDAMTSQLAKKIAHHEIQSNKLSERELAMRLESEPEDDWDDLINPSLLCPACKNRSLTARGDFDEEGDEEDGFYRFYYVVMECRVCKLELVFNEVKHILENFESFFELALQNEKPQWDLAAEQPDEYLPIK